MPVVPLEYADLISTVLALLALPDGAIRTDLQFHDPLFQYAKVHVMSWYRWLNSLGSNALNGSLYLVTGADKTTNWCVASYSNASETAGVLSFIPAGAGTVGLAGGYSWRGTGPVRVRTCPIRSEGSSTSQCVFIRGYKLVLSEGLYKRTFVGPVQVSDIVSSNHGDLLTKGRNIPEATKPAGWLSWLSGKDHGSGPNISVELIASEGNIVVEDFPKVSEVKL